MGISRSTSRDRVQQLWDLGRKIWRRWWLVAVFAVAGGGVSLGFAVSRPRSYVSSATVFYQERIESQLLSPGRDDVAQRNIGDRYRELLLADGQLAQIVREPGLDPFPGEPDPARKIDQLRRAVHFVAHGAMVFRIEYSDSDPDRAMRIVDKLTRLLQETDDSLRIQQSTRTVEFLTRRRTPPRPSSPGARPRSTRSWPSTPSSPRTPARPRSARRLPGPGTPAACCRQSSSGSGRSRHSSTASASRCPALRRRRVRKPSRRTPRSTARCARSRPPRARSTTRGARGSPTGIPQ